MKSTYERIVDLNNGAIATCLQHGHHDSAIQMLLSALHQLQSLDTHLQPHKENSSCVQKQHESSQRCSIAIQWVKMETPDYCFEDQIMGSPLSMYNYAVTLSPTPHPHGNQSVLATRATLLYNLAYLYHWLAIHRGTSSAKSVALSLYEQAGESIQHLCNHDGGNKMLEHLALAVLNNMGHIHYQLLQYHQARQCFYFLRLRLSARIGSLPLLYAMEGNETFVMNAMLPITESLLAPAA